MSKIRLVLDTNIIIYYLAGSKQLRKVVEQNDHVVSAITEIELCIGKHVTKPQQQIIHSLLSNFEIAFINNDIHQLAIEMRMKYDLKTMDAIVAATAIDMDLPLFSADKQLQRVKELKFLLFKP